MSTMGRLVNEVESQFGMSHVKAGSLLSSVLRLVQEQNGGLSGFLDRFRRIGLSDMVSGWLRGAPTTPISPENVQNALGTQTVNTIASRTGLSFATVASALGFMLPKLVQNLAPGGKIPSRLPSEAMSYLTGIPALVTGSHSTGTFAERARLGRMLWPLLALVGALLLFMLWSRNTSTSFNVEEQIRIASEKATAALASLKPGFAVPDMVNALNLAIINFNPGSAQVPDSSTGFLNKAAEVIKMAPTGTIIEIDGHTDNTGDPAANLSLSQQRAEAVRNYLVQQGVRASQLTAKGYGDSRPVAGNNTDEGHFHNRRIEFKAL